jgi:hypothetical protein
VTYEFWTKELRVPLFGVIEADDKEPFWAAFADPTAIRQLVSIDNGAMDIVAEDLELDANGLMVDASRYVRGEYRAKARGLLGGPLGAFGEVLSFLVQRAVPGREIERVVSWRANGLPTKDNAFPQPDFLLHEGGLTGALEVKSTEALDFQTLLRMNKWKSLGPCAGVGRCREEALGQLGYVDGQATAQKHALKIRDGRVVPFPADFGVASAVLARDGRLDALRTDSRYKTPRACRAAPTPRSCWSCIGADDGLAPAHVVIAELRNAPHRLPLVPPGEGGGAWLSAYRWWRHTMWARAPHAARDATLSLAHATVEWLGGTRLEDGVRTTLLAFWGSYLRDVAADRGMTISKDPARLPDLAQAAPHLGWEPLALRRPEVAEVTREAVFQLWPGVVDGREAAAFSFQSSGGQGTEEAVDVFTVRSDTSGWAISCLPREWRSGRALGDEGAARIAARLVALALALGRWVPPEEDGRRFPVPLGRTSLCVGENEVHVGWAVKSITSAPGAWRAVWRRWPSTGPPWWFWPGEPEAGPPWLGLLAMGDRRVRLVVLPDGRGLLRVPHLPGTTG